MANPVDPPHEAACVDSHLPPATVAVYLDPSQKDWVVPYVRGLVAVSGVMAVGRHEETDGRVSWVRLQLDADATRGMSGVGRARSVGHEGLRAAVHADRPVKGGQSTRAH